MPLCFLVAIFWRFLYPFLFHWILKRVFTNAVSGWGGNIIVPFAKVFPFQERPVFVTRNYSWLYCWVHIFDSGLVKEDGGFSVDSVMIGDPDGLPLFTQEDYGILLIASVTMSWQMWYIHSWVSVVTFLVTLWYIWTLSYWSLYFTWWMIIVRFEVLMSSVPFFCTSR